MWEWESTIALGLISYKQRDGASCGVVSYRASSLVQRSIDNILFALFVLQYCIGHQTGNGMEHRMNEWSGGCGQIPSRLTYWQG